MTLVEVMVSMAVGVVVIGAATWFLFEGTKASYKAMANVENSIQQWGLATKLQIDGKIAGRVDILNSIDQTAWVSGLPLVIPVDNGDPADLLERGKVLVLTKSQLKEGYDTKIITDMVVYYYVGGNLGYTGILKRFPQKAPDTFPITAPLDSAKNPKSVAQLVSENVDTITANAALVQDHLASIANNGPFAHFISPSNVSIALVRQETALGTVNSTTLTEVSFNLR